MGVKKLINWSVIVLNLNKQNQMSNMTKSPTSEEFSVLVLITFLLKIDIYGIAVLIWLDADED